VLRALVAGRFASKAIGKLGITRKDVESEIREVRRNRKNTGN